MLAVFFCSVNSSCLCCSHLWFLAKVRCEENSTRRQANPFGEVVLQSLCRYVCHNLPDCGSAIITWNLVHFFWLMLIREHHILHALMNAWRVHFIISLTSCGVQHYEEDNPMHFNWYWSETKQQWERRRAVQQKPKLAKDGVPKLQGT